MVDGSLPFGEWIRGRGMFGLTRWMGGRFGRIDGGRIDDWGGREGGSLGWCCWGAVKGPWVEWRVDGKTRRVWVIAAKK